MKTDTDKLLDTIVDEFLRWPLPDSVCADGCATKQGPGRVGTNLLSAIEAKQMFAAIVLPNVEKIDLATIRQRDAAEEAADKIAGVVLGEPIDWSDHEAKWAEALEEVESEKARVEAIATKMRKFVAENYPAAPNGQVDFVRALIEGYAAELLSENPL